jgi:hypothetical protein
MIAAPVGPQPPAMPLVVLGTSTSGPALITLVWCR